MRGHAVRTAIACLVMSLACAASQTPSAAQPPDALRARLKNESLQVVTSIRGLPLGVRDGLQELFASQTLDIAEPGTEFQLTDAIKNSQLPTRRLVAAGCSIEHCLVYYERGGIAHSWHVAVFRWTPAATRFEWGGLAPNSLANIEAVRAAVLSGSIKSSTTW